MELRAGEHELYEGRPSWRAIMSYLITTQRLGSAAAS
jgi:hypothetical protein